MKQRLSPENQKAQHLAVARYVFWGWMIIGLLLMLFYHVPRGLEFSNGLFNIFFALYAFILLWEASRSSRENQSREAGQPDWMLLLCIVLIGLVTFAAEWIGMKSGLPFGEYEYTNVLRFTGSGVPVSIAFAWAGIVVCGVLVSRAQTRIGRALEVGVVALWFDLVLDPVAAAREFWIWKDSAEWGSYYGIPLQNFLSWLVLAMLMSLLLPKLATPPPLRKEALRLSQGMLFMFGLLAGKELLWWPLGIAAAGLIVLEGRIRLDRSEQKPSL